MQCLHIRKYFGTIFSALQSLSPGPVATDLVGPDFRKIMELQIPMLKPEEISKAILYILGTPADVAVSINQ